MRSCNKRIEKYASKISGDITKIRTDNYKDFQVKNYKSSVGLQIEIENKVKSFMSKWGLPSLHTNYYILFLKRILSERYCKSAEEADITFNKWCARGLPYDNLRFLGRNFANRRLDLRTINRVQNMKVYLSCYEGTGTMIHDLSGNENNATLSGNGWVNDGVIGKGIRFGAGFADYVRVENNDDLKLSIGGEAQPRTLIAWIKGFEPFAEEPNENLLIGKGDEDLTPEASEYKMYINNSDGFRIAASDGSNWNAITIIPKEDIDLIKGKWVFCALSLNGGVQKNLVSLVVISEDGIGGIIEGPFIKIVTNETTNPVWLGGTSAAGNPYQANGYADEIRSYNKYMGVEELLKIFEGEKFRKLTTLL
jgi:hypothetical protein